jgi:hypothetical protein
MKVHLQRAYRMTISRRHHVTLLAVFVVRCLCCLSLQVQLSSLQTSLADAERRVYESELIRRKLHNTIQVSTHGPGSDLFRAAPARHASA